MDILVLKFLLLIRGIPSTDVLTILLQCYSGTQNGVLFTAVFLNAEVCDKEVPLSMHVYKICTLHTEENVHIPSCKMC